MPARAELAALVAILLAAAWLRFHALDSTPPGFSHDEANHTHDAAGVLDGVRPIYFTIGYGREPLYDYTTSLVMLAVGRRGYASRLTAAFCGLLLVPVTWAWARRAFGAGAALLAAGLLAVDFWPVMAARQALRSIMLPGLLMAAVYWQQRALPAPYAGPGLPSPGGGAGVPPPPGERGTKAGLLLGATFYTYLAARITWAIFPAALVYFALFRRDLLRRAWRPTVWMLLVAAAVSAPLFGWLLANPGAETRIGDLAYPIDQAQAGNWEPLLTNAGAALGVFTWAGDPLWMYNLPGRPMVAPLVGVLFVAGLGMAAVQAVRGRPAPAFLLIWLAVGIAPSLVTGPGAAATRAVGLMPAPYILAAWAFAAVGRSIAHGFSRGSLDHRLRPALREDEKEIFYHGAHGEHRERGDFFSSLRVLRAFRGCLQRASRRLAPTVAIIAAILIALTGLTTYHEYFDIWANAPDVRVAYHTNLVQTAAYLDASRDASPLLMSSIRPEAPHDPSIVRAVLRRADLRIRWFDARGALVFPDEATVRVALPEITPLDARLAPYFAAAAPVHRVELPPGDFNRTTDIYVWQPRAALARALPGLDTTMTPVDPADGAPVLELLGYAAAPPDALVTFWRALATYGEKETDGIKLFVHVLGADGSLIDQDDRLDAPAWTWQPGDVFAQVHGVDLRGAHEIVVGAYDRDTLNRLPVLVSGATGQRVRLDVP
ncbi:MAG: glycosyltransferase family 39 protein [Anaerolineae bacterium]|nr:glycosyltransferase family 39 protein [Anaerolineae bacterium]